jgi:membrane protease subunit (stomatin/prohibitin family)
MTLRDLIAGELIDIIEWLETSQDTMVWRFARPNNEIKNGAQLIVRPGQLAVFVDQGNVADVFLPGRHELTTANLPVLSRLRGWKYGFHSPFKAEVVFVSTRQFQGCKWGTKAPVMTTDPELGPVRLRAFGTYAVRVSDPEAFVRELVGANHTFDIDQISDQLRDLMVARFSDLLGEQATSVLALASQYDELGAKTAARLAPELARFGIETTQFNVESIALPDEVAATLDQRTRMNLLGDVGAYAQLQAPDALRDAARTPGGGAAAAGAAMGVGLAVGQQLAGTVNSALHPTIATPAAQRAAPPPIPPAAAFFMALDGKPVGPFDIGALRQRVADGSLTRDTLVWREGMPQWAAASSVAEVASLFG